MDSLPKIWQETEHTNVPGEQPDNRLMDQTYIARDMLQTLSEHLYRSLLSITNYSITQTQVQHL